MATQLLVRAYPALLPDAVANPEPLSHKAPTPCAQVVLELFLEKAQATGSPDADLPAMVALGADRGTYREQPAADKCAHAAHAPSAAATNDCWVLPQCCSPRPPPV